MGEADRNLVILIHSEGTAPAPDRLSRLEPTHVISSFSELDDQSAGFSGDLLYWRIESADHLTDEAISDAASLLELHRLEENELTLFTDDFLPHTGSDPKGNQPGPGVIRDQKGLIINIESDPPEVLNPQRDSCRTEHCLPLLVIKTSALESVNSAAAGGDDFGRANRQGADFYSLAGSVLESGKRVGAAHPKSIESILTVEPIAECKYCMPDPRINAESGILVISDTMLLAVDRPGFNSGQLMILPRRHITTFATLTRQELSEICELIPLAEAKLRKLYTFDALNIGVSSGAGEHLVMRLIPRWVGDLNFLPLVSGLKPVPDSPELAWERFQKELS